MRGQKLTKLTLLGLGVALAAFYQNFSFDSKVETNIKVQQVDEAARLAQAKELLGKAMFEYNRNVHSKQGKKLSQSISRTLIDRLPAAYKHKSKMIAQTIIEESDFYELDPVLVLAMIKTESKFNPVAIGTHGEIGLLQVRPETAEWVAKREGYDWRGPVSLKDPVTNIRIGIAFINILRQSFDGSAGKYLSAYNMGAHKVRQLAAAETKPKIYPIRVMKNYEELYAQLMIF